MWMKLMESLLADLIVGVIVGIPILIAIKVTEKIGSDYCWVNRKIIHFSTVPALYAYLYIFNEVYVWTIASLAFFLYTLIPHLMDREMKWFQIKGNFGEVYYCLMYFFIGSAFFYINRPLAVVAMLLTAIGDGVTGIVRFFLFKKKEEAITLYTSTNPQIRKACKTLIGTIAFIIAGIPISIFLLETLKGTLVTFISAIAEKQHLIDDNLAIPIATIISYYLISTI